MFRLSTYFFWAVWALISVGAAAYAAKTIYVSGDRTVLLPGQTTGVHHQFEVSCNTCHTSDNFEDVNSVRKDLNKTCVTCHKEELKASDDSHPIKKFTNPRMAAFWDRVDARFCTSCHLEHVPDETLAGALTLAGDFCVACHSEGEQNVRVNRESHADLEFDTCASSGCHNFHDNRALYEDFLVKHGKDPWLLENTIIEAAAMARGTPDADQAEIAIYLASVVASPEALDADIENDWAHSAHAQADVGCGGCHAAGFETDAEILANWTEKPDEAVCADCHGNEAETFAFGRHGMRRHPEIAGPRQPSDILKTVGIDEPSERMVNLLDTYLADPDTPAVMSTVEARVSLLPEAHGRELTCSTCHAPHEQNISYAAVDGCLSCHNDEHSTSYKDSLHFSLWEAELNGALPPGSGVTCATCHMPQVVKGDDVRTNHNQNDTLRPNEKMIRATCMSCHGLGFAIDALADPILVNNNFQGHPNRHIESIDWALNRVETPDTDANQ
ncbi:MAG: ammonia-forming cytochrome c nitrite reductase subunit c552 [Pseudomonadota bacterium]